jgi:hypothetical protein
MVEAVKPAKADVPIYRLKVTMKGIKPPIWRRIEVKSDISLYKLHRILQVVMGWGDYHMYDFTAAGNHYGEPDPEMGPEMKSSQRVKLHQIAPEPKRRFTYSYDFGDDWEHEILMEKVILVEAGVRYPRCTGGARACPPEDCGGIWGYDRLLKIIADPQDPEYDEMMEWLGGSYDPEAFDLEGVNERLRRIR